MYVDKWVIFSFVIFTLPMRVHSFLLYLACHVKKETTVKKVKFEFLHSLLIQCFSGVEFKSLAPLFPHKRPIWKNLFWRARYWLEHFVKGQHFVLFWRVKKACKKHFFCAKLVNFTLHWERFVAFHGPSQVQHLTN